MKNKITSALANVVAGICIYGPEVPSGGFIYAPEVPAEVKMLREKSR